MPMRKEGGGIYSAHIATRKCTTFYRHKRCYYDFRIKRWTTVGKIESLDNEGSGQDIDALPHISTEGVCVIHNLLEAHAHNSCDF